jgi:hypothetical protein
MPIRKTNRLHDLLSILLAVRRMKGSPNRGRN